MKTIYILLLIVSIGVKAQQVTSCSPLPGPAPDFFTLDEKDLFVITEYKETEYQTFLEQDSLNLPANLSSVNYYVDINGETDSSNLTDINYLYLQGYHDKTKTSGELFYLLSTKNIPMGNRKTNVRSAKSVDLYSELSSIVNMSFGYWQMDTVTHRVFIIFREGTKIWNMNNFRVFAGLILNKNIYLTRAMNTKDSYLFDYNFKKNKEIFVKLPINLENVFYLDSVKTEDADWWDGAILSHDEAKKVKNGMDLEKISDNRKLRSLDWSRTGNESMERNQAFLPQQKMTLPVYDKPVYDKVKKSASSKAGVKYSYFPFNRSNFEKRKIEYLNYDALSFAFLKKKNGATGKYVLLKGRKGDLFTYSRINLKQYKKYYSDHNLKEFIFIHIIDPYDEKFYYTFTIPYSGENFVPRVLYFIKKKLFDI